jgi:integrase
MKYLLSLEITRYTAQHYLVAYKATLNQAVRLRKIEYNPAKILNIRYESKKVERLTFPELKKLQKTYCKYPDIKNGFLFSCFTGLRISDIRNLKFSDIKNDHIEIILKKNKTPISIKINETAKKIVVEQKKRKIDKFVFHIPLGGKTSNRLKDWIKQAGIHKKLTFHCSRHTFGCMLIENGVDVFTVKKLMGHKDVRTTLKYVDKVDETRDKGIDRLPNL